MEEQELELITFADVMKKPYVLILLPTGVIGVYRPNADAFVQSVKNLMAENREEGKVTALVPVALSEEEFLRLNSGDETAGDETLQ